MIEFDIEGKERAIACIKVVGVGGGGGNTVNSMIDANLENIEFIVANTDAQALQLSHAHHKIQLGAKSTKGLGTGADPELGKRAAEEDLTKVMDLLEDADIVFLTAGMGGGTGSGGLPVIAKALREKNILTIAVLTKPFAFEGKRRAQVASDTIAQLRKEVDTLLVIPNQKLLETVDQHVSMIDAFAMINAVLTQSVKGIADIISKPGHINVDFADVKTIMRGMGLAVMGTARASGPERATQAARQAISSPLLETMNIQGARGVLLNISGGCSLGLHEIGIAAQLITQQADENAHIIVGSVIDHALEDDILITVIATGFSPIEQQPQAQQSMRPAISAEKQTTKPAHVEPIKETKQQEPEITRTTNALTEAPEQKTISTEPIHQTPYTHMTHTTDFDVPTFLRQKKEHENLN